MGRADVKFPPTWYARASSADKPTPMHATTQFTLHLVISDHSGCCYATASGDVVSQLANKSLSEQASVEHHARSRVGGSLNLQTAGGMVQFGRYTMRIRSFKTTVEGKTRMVRQV